MSDSDSDSDSNEWWQLWVALGRGVQIEVYLPKRIAALRAAEIRRSMLFRDGDSIESRTITEVMGFTKEKTPLQSVIAFDARHAIAVGIREAPEVHLR